MSPPHATAVSVAHEAVSTAEGRGVLVPRTAGDFKTSLAAVWSKIRVEYITSPENPTVEVLAAKYREHVGSEAIRKRITDEKWVDEREQWWAAAEVKLLERIADQYLAERVREMKVLRRAFDALAEHALPLTDKAGNVLRGEDGLPRFALPFRSQDKVINALLTVQERQMLLRGEAIMRTESAIKDKQAADSDGDDETLSSLAGRVNFSPKELRTFAREFVRKREAALAEPEDEEGAPPDVGDSTKEV